MKRILAPDFFNRPTLSVAHDLIGKYIVREYKGITEAYKIIEVEAYLGEKDLASHARAGRTSRTEIMYGLPGYFYVYFIYGIHWMLNIVTEEKNQPTAILIRGIMKNDHIISGPGRVTKALHIDKKINEKPALPESGLWFETRFEKKERERENNMSPSHILRTPRIGVGYAGPIWALKKYRFILKSKFLLH